MQNNRADATQSDEIDLVQLCRTLWAGRWLVVSCMVLALLLASLYVFVVAQPRYASSIHLNAPPASSLEELNRGRERANFMLAQPPAPNADNRQRENERAPAGLALYTPAKVFGFFAQSLNSDGVFQQFLRKVLNYSDDTPMSASSLERNGWRVNVTAPDPDGRNQYRVTVLAESPELAQRHLALFLEAAQAQALQTLLDDASSDVAIRIDSIENTLATQRAIARKQREDRIVQLREALTIAEAISQETPQVNLARPSGPESLSGYLEGKELYARGVRALKAELEILEARESDDAFITDLRKNEARLQLLRAISPETDSLLLYRIDGTVFSPESPVHPRRALILALALVLGGMAGVFWVLVRGMLRTQRRDTHPPAQPLLTDTA